MPSEKPILFNGDMVRAILEGRKTQTRRIVTPQPPGSAPKRFPCEWYEPIVIRCGQQQPGPRVFGFWNEDAGWKCPYGAPGNKYWQRGTPIHSGWYFIRGLLDDAIGGDQRAVFYNATYQTWAFSETDDQKSIWMDDFSWNGWRRPGDRLWVREPARLVESNRHIHQACGGDVVRVEYRADGLISDWLPYPERLATLQMGRGLPNGCYREASRLTLEITDVRVERLQEISYDDACAEGAWRLDWASDHTKTMEHPTWKQAWVDLWDSINGTNPTANWNANPFVWVVSFRRIAK